jgi:tetratricopeptide (TPR) repeat protein
MSVRPSRPAAADPATGTLDQVVVALQAAHGGDEAARAAAIDALDRWLVRGYDPPQSAPDEGRLIAAGRWMLNDRAGHPVIPVWAARATQVLREIDDEPLAALLAAFSFEHSIRIGDFIEAGRLVERMWDRTAAHPSARAEWLPSAALYLWLSGRADAALAELTAALSKPGLEPRLRYALLEQAASAALAKGDAAACVDYLDAAQPFDDAMSLQDRAHAWFLRAGAAAVAGDFGAAVAAMERCDGLARHVHARFFHALWRLGGAAVRLQAGQARRAERELTELLGDVVLMRARYLEWSVRLARAAARLALRRDAAGEADLASALRIAADNGYVNADPWAFTAPVPALLAHALERGIEARTARAILAHHGS